MSAPPCTLPKGVHWCLLVVAVAAWLTVLYQQHLLLEEHPLTSFFTMADFARSWPVPAGRMPHSISRQPAGTFNNVTVYYETREPFFSSWECIDHHHDDMEHAWRSRSCRYRNLCFNVDTEDYAVIGQSVPPSVAVGGLNPRWEMVGDKSMAGSHKVQWAPRLVDFISSYYRLPNDYVWMPIYSFAGHNVGHLLWDDFYPLYRLARLFGLEHEHRWLVVRADKVEPLYAGCDLRRNKRMQCMSNFRRFLPMLGVDPMTFGTQKRSVLDVKERESPWVCAATAVAGVGFLTDHGQHDHGWEASSSWIPHNLGRGREFADFSNFVLDHLAQSGRVPRTRPVEPPLVTLSLLSSRDWDRRLNFTTQIEALEAALPSSVATIGPVTLWDMTLEEQVTIAQQSSIFISSCGGASMTATFLPRNAALIVYYNPTGSLDFRAFQPNHAPARLDWDLLNNAAHLRVHWLPVTDMDEARNVELLVRLVQHELKVLKNMG